MSQAFIVAIVVVVTAGGNAKLLHSYNCVILRLPVLGSPRILNQPFFGQFDTDVFYIRLAEHECLKDAVH